MADLQPQFQTEPAIGSEEYFRRMHPTAQHGSGLPPAVQDTVAAAKSAVTPTDVYRQPVPPGQIEDGLLRGAGIAANQFAIGTLGIPAAALHYGWEGAHALAPGIGEPPAWTSAEGPGSYGEALTYGPLTPSTPAERILAHGARATGTAATGMLAGMGPVAAGVNALGGFAGGAATEAGYPNVGAGIEFGTGLATGLGTVARRMPFTNPPSSMWTSLSGGPPLPSPAMLEAHRMAQLVRMEMWAPLTHRLPFGTGVALNYALTRGMNNPITAGATTAASRILGFGVGAGVGGASATENYPPPAISYSAPPNFTQPPNQ